MSSGGINKKRKGVPVNPALQRKTALLFIATGSVFTAIGSMLGVAMIFDQSFSPNIIPIRFFSVHPYLQIFGFLAEFIFGVAYSLIPSLKSYGLPSHRLAYISFFLITAANAGFIISSWLLPAGQSSDIVLYASLVLELAASLIFLYEISQVILSGRNSQLKGDAYILLSALSFTAAVISVITSQLIGEEQFSFGIVYLLLIGFVGSMIFGITTKTAGIRFTKIHRNLYPFAVYAQLAAIVATLLYVFIPNEYTTGSTFTLFLISIILYVLMSRTLTRSRLLFSRERRGKAHLGKTTGQINLTYVEASFMSASGWLITGVLLSLLYALTGRFWMEIAFIHSFSIGFAGSAIIGFAPVLLPGILSRKSPSGRNTLLPLYLLDVGLAIFVAGDIVSSHTMQLPYWTGIGGLSIVLSMIVFMYELHEDLLPKKTVLKDENFTDSW